MISINKNMLITQPGNEEAGFDRYYSTGGVVEMSTHLYDHITAGALKQK